MRRTGSLPFLCALALVLPCLAFGAAAARERLRADRVLVEKRDRRLTLFWKKEPVKVYQIALGVEPVGAKRCQGDNRTPEGTYKVESRNRGSSFHRSLRVSYPNQEDVRRAKELGCRPGGDIMIHGLPNGQGKIGAGHRQSDWTAGCIAVTNEEIEEIWGAVPDGTAIEIRP